MAVSGPATLDSVAARAGVSRQTVSNVLRHPDRVAEATRQRVLDAIRESGYRPSLPARQLATRRAHAIAVRAERQQDGISGLVLDAFYHGLAEAGQDNGLRVLLYPQPVDEAAEVATIDELVHTGAADAVVLTATSADDERPAHLRERGTTFCAFGRPWGHEDEPHDWVDVDGSVGTGLAVDHLLALGHRRIAYLGWPGDGDQPSTGTDRRGGWLRALEAAGLGGAVIDVRSTNDSAAAQAVVAGLLTGPDAPDAIVCASDTLALGAHRAALATPGDPPTIVGFDATPVAAALGLASVAQPIDEVAHLCIDLLTSRFETPDRPARGLLVRPVLHLPT
ncbi:DNA-binding LacI/PurR family transcriptional regulator [Nocardioides sp. BE266]|uniref:LacI family DNA-binding transcriptional regulator n=1 Tax=Nocardioides sp. BE266 TaxID=2817725 RepID=UPI0028670DE7|nr:LacI family DNA-binding transcriptional regulator [Nocardioides sp. BE266]MDR7251603.1 DNA-binding LacI/PurR family transcriptional regulator [Nocardioides sp. BE266]